RVASQAWHELDLFGHLRVLGRDRFFAIIAARRRSTSGSTDRCPALRRDCLCRFFVLQRDCARESRSLLKPVLAEVEQDTNEETPLVSETTFAEEIADATAPGPARQVTALH